MLRTVFSERLILTEECLVLVVSTAEFLKVKQRGKAGVGVILPLPEREVSAG